MNIEIHIPRPFLLLLTVAAVSGWAIVLMQPGDRAHMEPLVAQVTKPIEEPVDAGSDAEVVAMDHDHSHDDMMDGAGGGDPAMRAQALVEERKVQQLRSEQEMLRAKQDILRAQLDALTEERRQLGSTIDPELEIQFRRSAQMLVDLMRDEQRAEQFLRTSFNQIWEADGRALASVSEGKTPSRIVLAWPVTPALGVSARFLDVAYEQRFKFKHYGVDVPVNQGSPVRAAAGGIVKDVVDHGLGFNYVVIQHPGGYATLYGHMSKFDVQEGQTIVAGDRVGWSGGRPGTPGAGFSTGPHLHFGLYVNGAAVDPGPYLPAL